MIFDKKRFRTLTDEVADELGITIKILGFRKSTFYPADSDESALQTLIHAPFELDILFSLEQRAASTITIQVDPLDSDQTVKNKVRTRLGAVLLSGPAASH